MEEPKLIESIKLEDGIFYHLDLHNKRMNQSCAALGITHEPYALASYLEKFDYPKEGLYKCRVLYDERIKTIHFQRYWPKAIKNLQVVYTENIDYTFKTVGRSALDRLNQLKRFRSDIIIVRNGLVTDSYYGNLLFLKEGIWYTPESPLLAGVQRSFLLSQNLIQSAVISAKDIRKYQRVKIINAMLDLENGPEVDIRNVHLFY